MRNLPTLHTIFSIVFSTNRLWTFLLCSFCTLFSARLSAQPMSAAAILDGEPKLDTTGWAVKGNLGINLTSIGLSNWAGGGQNATSILGLLNFTANFKSPSFAWDNAVELGYGLTWLGNQAPAVKSDDRIIFISKASIPMAERLRLSALVDFRTQFTVGENNAEPVGSENRKISNIFAPAFLTAALGASWKPADYMTILLAPATGRIVIVGDPELSARGVFGVPAGKTVLAEIGALLNFQLKRDIFENVNLATRLNVFSPYQNFTAPIVNWENIVILKVNKFLNVSLAGDLIYGVPVTNSANLLQMRGVIAIGFVLPF